jgi:hypothetical protein
MVYRGVVAIVSILDGRRLVGEELRFIPLSKDGSLIAEGNRRLRVTRARKGEIDPELLEKDLRVYAGRLVAADATEFDENWLYGCVDISQRQA